MRTVIDFYGPEAPGGGHIWTNLPCPGAVIAAAQAGFSCPVCCR